MELHSAWPANRGGALGQSGCYCFPHKGWVRAIVGKEGMCGESPPGARGILWGDLHQREEGPESINEGSGIGGHGFWGGAIS